MARSMRKRIALVAFAVAFTGTSCTKDKELSSEQPKRAEEKQLQPEDRSIKNDLGDSQVPIVLYKSSLSAALNLDSDNLVARLTFGEYKNEKKITFESDKANLNFASLPSNQENDLTLKVFEDDVAKLAGTLTKIKLTPGTNKLSIKLRGVAEDSADLTVDVSVGESSTSNGGSGDGNSNTDQGNGSGTNPDPGTGNPGSGDTSSGQGNPGSSGSSGNGTGTQGTGTDNSGGLGGDDVGGDIDVDLANVTYEDVKKFVIIPYCEPCHSDPKDMVVLNRFPFQTYFFTSQQRIFERLLETTSRVDAKPMPPDPSPPLPAKRREVLVKWIEQGAKP